MSERALVAMSGGVDSSVAAARLKHEGFDVVGVTLHLWDYPDDGSVKGRCCAPEDIHDARRVCDRLGIPHFAFDRRELFEREVVTPFVEAYLSGETPSPCVRCNRGVKLHELLTIADRLQAPTVATGHYARLDLSGRIPKLLRATDRNKDQSYFLHMLDARTLRRLRFPLGEATKQEVRQEAIRLALPGAHKGESQELCFVPTGRYDRFVAERAAERLRPGKIVDASGRELAQHAGVHRFTVGQRKNLGVATGQRAYVVGLNSEDGTVQLGSRQQLQSSHARLEQFVLAEDLSLPLSCEVAVRYRGTTHLARVAPSGSGDVVVEFRDPVLAVVPGQVAVLYDGERVLGGGTIASSGNADGLRRLPLAATTDRRSSSNSGAQGSIASAGAAEREADVQ
jgi:tRNA-uridine 2-sulfurtransferase